MDKEVEQVEGDETLAQLNISSNIEDYNIEIVECDQEDVQDIEVDKSDVYLGANGPGDVINITTTPKGLAWRISK